MHQGKWDSLHWLWDCLQHDREFHPELQIRASLKPH